MANTQVSISQNGKTTLATAGKYCERNIDINVAVASADNDIPSYVKTEADSLVSKVVSAQGNRVFTLAAISDLHYGNGSYTDGILHASQALAYIRKQITLDAFAVLGDYTDGYPADSVDNAFGDCRKINSLLAPMEAVPNMRIQGNHDFYSGYAQFVHYHIQAYSEGVTWGDKNGGYFYRDFADKKLRIICVNTTETDNANLTVSTTQYTWFVNALDLSAKSGAADWQILVLSHHPLDWYVSDGTYRFAYIMEAYKNGASGTVGGVSYNFSGKNSATLIGNIHGHIHNLLVDYINKGNVNTSNPTKVLRICTPEACINRANQYDGAWKDSTTHNKTTYSAKDTSFVVYCIDLNAQSIKAFCYGAGYDREISYAPVAPAVYSITNILTNCAASGVSSITEGGTATITISTNNEYELPDTIVVSGASYTWDKSTGTLTLSNPTSNVTVTVVAIEAELPYKNQIRLSINADGTQFVGTNGEDGYKMGYRLNSSGTETAITDNNASIVGVTGYIPIKTGDIVYIDGLLLKPGVDTGVDNYSYVNIYRSDFSFLTGCKFVSINESSMNFMYGGSCTTDASGYATSFKIVDNYNSLKDGGYLRISGNGMSVNSIITVNEPINGVDVYSITNSLANCTASGASTIAKDGTASIAIIANSGYELPDTIAISGASYTWNKSTGIIVLSNPTGNVTVTVVATEITVSYNNQIPLSINEDKTQYVGHNGEDGYSMGYRMNSSGTETKLTDVSVDIVGVTGYIPVKTGDTIYLKNLRMNKNDEYADSGANTHSYISLFLGDFTMLLSVKAHNVSSSHAYIFGDNLLTADSNGHVTSFKLVDKYNNLKNGGYIRISAPGMSAQTIITVNQPIDEVLDSETQYTNQIPLSITSSKTDFVGTNGEDGYKTNYRLNSSGAEASFTGWEVTGFIPVTASSDVYFYNIDWNSDGQNKDYLAIYDSNFACISSTLLATWLNGITASNYTKDEKGNPTWVNTATFVSGNYGAPSGGREALAKMAYIRISACEINASSIITVDEPIE